MRINWACFCKKHPILISYKTYQWRRGDFLWAAHNQRNRAGIIGTGDTAHIRPDGPTGIDFYWV